MKSERKTPLFLLMILICFPQLSETIYTPALPALSNYFAVSSELAQWTLSIYFIGFAVGVAFWGQYSDRVGRRLAILRGMCVYLFACVGCALAPSITLFFFFRILQAFGVSIGSVVVQGILRESYEGDSRKQVFALINMFMAFSPALGPFIGGYLTQWFGWKSNFLILLIFGSILLVTLYFRLQETNAYLGTQRDFKERMKIFKSILANPRAMSFVVLVGLFNGVMFSYYSQAPFVFIDLLHLTADQYGRLGIYAAMGVVVGSLISKALTKRYSSDALVGAGCLGAFVSIAILNVALFSSLGQGISPVVLIVFPMFLFFIAFSLAIPSLLGTALIGYERSIGTASSIFGLLYYILTATFNFLMGYFDNGTIAPMPLYFLALSILMLVTFLSFRQWRKVV